jgi:hypothetical protein
MTHPTLLRMPTWYSKTAFEEMPLSLPRDAYAITTLGDRVRVTEAATGQLVYAGIGPVEIIESPAPF